MAAPAAGKRNVLLDEAACWSRRRARVNLRSPAGSAGTGDRALRLGDGLVVSDLLQAGGEVQDQRVARRLWPQTVALAQAHLAAGDEVWLVSAAPVELVAIIADRLGLTGGLGTASETHEGRSTSTACGTCSRCAARLSASAAPRPHRRALWVLRSPRRTALLVLRRWRRRCRSCRAGGGRAGSAGGPRPRRCLRRPGAGRGRSRSCR